MLIYEILSEKYTERNSALLRYLQDGHNIDHYNNWYIVCRWIDDNDKLEEISEITGEDFKDIDELEEHDPVIYDQFPDNWKSKIIEYVTDYLHRHDPAELPTTSFLSPNQKRLLPAQTWLVHFSDNADKIYHNGFKIGMYDMSKLGLTTYFKNTSYEKSDGGYNFAFIANSRYANWAAGRHAYGRDAVIFQNSGVSAWHGSDEEEQIIFIGEDVDPKKMVLLRYTNEGWVVTSRNSNKRDLFVGDFDKCVQWVMKNYQSYRKNL